MKFRITLISALLASFSSSALADTIVWNNNSSLHQPTIIRGAPSRCDSNQPLVINVSKSLREGFASQYRCKVAKKRAGRDRTISITNIVVIAPYYKHVYIKHY